MPSQILYLELYSNQVKAGANKTGNKFVIGTNFRRQKEGGQNLKHRLEQIFDAADRGRAKSKFESSSLGVGNSNRVALGWVGVGCGSRI